MHAFIQKIDEILNNNNDERINVIINEIMNLTIILLEEIHPSIVLKALELLRRLLEYIQKCNIELEIDVLKKRLINEVLFKIKLKLGDVNPKVRNNCISFYCDLLTLKFLDYNKLITELVIDEIKNNNKYSTKSGNLIVGKINIIINALSNFENAITMKRTDKISFPSNLLMDYLINNISHNKYEIRKQSRSAMKLLFKIFGIEKFKKNLEKIDERVLRNLIEKIPNLQGYFPKKIIIPKIGVVISTSKSRNITLNNTKLISHNNT